MGGRLLAVGYSKAAVNEVCPEMARLPNASNPASFLDDDRCQKFVEHLRGDLSRHAGAVVPTYHVGSHLPFRRTKRPAPIDKGPPKVNFRRLERDTLARITWYFSNLADTRLFKVIPPSKILIPPSKILIPPSKIFFIQPAYVPQGVASNAPKPSKELYIRPPPGQFPHPADKYQRSL